MVEVQSSKNTNLHWMCMCCSKVESKKECAVRIRHLRSCEYFAVGFEVFAATRVFETPNLSKEDKLAFALWRRGSQRLACFRKPARWRRSGREMVATREK